MNMKTITLAILSSLLLIPFSAAQEAAGTPPEEARQQPRATLPKSGQESDATLSAEAAAAKERDEKLRQEERAKALLEKKAVVYSGFLVEASRAKEKKRLFSLRQPRDAKNDYRNIAFDERTNRPRGFVLFRIGF